MWIIFRVAIAGKNQLIVFSLGRGEKEISVKIDDEYDMIPPARHLFPAFIRRLRQIGRGAARDSKSHFRFVYTETGEERKLEWFINYDAEGDPLEEMHKITTGIVDTEKAAVMPEQKTYEREEFLSE